VVGRSTAMHDLFDALKRFARTDVTVTFVGETGAGKDILAHAMHQESLRGRGPLVVFDCGSVAANLAESELLGHERGAFTGAVAAHAGAFERAHGGTLFLDEVAELPLDLQPRLLRALESRTVRRVGGKQDKPVDSGKTSSFAWPSPSSGFRHFVSASTIYRSSSTPSSRIWVAPSFAGPTPRSMRSGHTHGPATFASSRTYSRVH
jgi:hypothetical protein